MPSQLLTIVKLYRLFYLIFPISYLEMLGLKALFDNRCNPGSAFSCVPWRPVSAPGSLGTRQQRCGHMARVPGLLVCSTEAQPCAALEQSPLSPTGMQFIHSSYAGECLRGVLLLFRALGALSVAQHSVPSHVCKTRAIDCSSSQTELFNDPRSSLTNSDFLG